MLLMIDNYDSFTFNIVQYLGELGADVKVVRNDEITVAEMAALNPDHIVFSPGPCTPNEAGVCVEAIQHFLGKKPLLGVCLGHQSMGQALGGRIIRAQRQMHGKASTITTDQRGVFSGLAVTSRWSRSQSASTSHTATRRSRSNCTRRSYGNPGAAPRSCPMIFQNAFCGCA
mgnify:CR=1 FL=1